MLLPECDYAPVEEYKNLNEPGRRAHKVYADVCTQCLDRYAEQYAETAINPIFESLDGNA